MPVQPVPERPRREKNTEEMTLRLPESLYYEILKRADKRDLKPAQYARRLVKLGLMFEKSTENLTECEDSDGD